MTLLLTALACLGPPPADDPTPFAGVLTALDADHDGIVHDEEYPLNPVGGARAETVDKNADLVISADEIRDEIYAVDPTLFDPMAQAHEGQGGSGTDHHPPPGPLAEAMVFLVDLASRRNPGATLPAREAILTAATSPPGSPEREAVAARLTDLGVRVPDSVRTAAADPPSPATPIPAAEERKPVLTPNTHLQSSGPGGAAAVRKPKGGRAEK